MDLLDDYSVMELLSRLPIRDLLVARQVSPRLYLLAARVFEGKGDWEFSNAKLRSLDPIISRRATTRLRFENCKVFARTAADFRSFPNLVRLEIVDSHLRARVVLNVSRNESLRFLNLSNTYIWFVRLNRGLEHLDLSRCNYYNALPQRLFFPTTISCLRWLDVSRSNVDSLDLSPAVHLETLLCNGCGLSLLDVSKNKELKFLDASINRLLEFTVYGNKKLETLDVSHNFLRSLNIDRARVKTLKCQCNCIAYLRPGTSLIELDCSKNCLTNLDVLLSRNVKLRELACRRQRSFRFGSSLERLDLSGNENLRILDCGDNALRSLVLTRNFNLEELRIDGNLSRTGKLLLKLPRRLKTPGGVWKLLRKENPGQLSKKLGGVWRLRQ